MRLSLDSAYSQPAQSRVNRMFELRLETQGGTSVAEAARDFVMGELVTKSDLQAAVDALSLQLSVRLGVMLATGIGILAAIIKL